MDYYELQGAIKRTITLILAGGRGSRLKNLTDFQAKPAVDFGGKYRIIDFAMSNCLHSGFRRISLLTQYQSHSLLRHVQRSWHLNNEMDEFIDLLPAQQKKTDNQWYMGTADAVYKNLHTLEKYGAQNVLVLAGDHVYKMDYSVMLADHILSDADVTVACLEVDREKATRFGVMFVDEKDRITDFLERPDNPPGIPGNPDRALASMGIYIFKAAFLYDELLRDAADPESSHDFGKDLIPYLVPRAKVMAHRFSKSCVRSNAHANAYWRDVGTVDTYWESNLELTNVIPELDLYDTKWPIFSYPEQLPPAKFIYGEHNDIGTARNSVFSPGCVICGSQIEKSLLSSNVRVDSYCTIQDSVLLPNVTVGRNTRIKKAIIDRGCQIPEGFTVGEDPEEDAKRFYRSKNGVVMITPEMLQSAAA